MIWPSILRMAVKNMKRHRLRTVLTLVGIAVALISFGLLRTIVDYWYASAAKSSAVRLVTRNAMSVSVPLPMTYGTRIRQVAGVSAVTWGTWFGGIYVNEHNFFPQLAVDASSYFDLYPDMVLPPAQQRAFIHDRLGCVVGRKLARKYGWKIGDRIPLRGTIYPGSWSFVIRGIYTGKTPKVDETYLLFHWDYLNARISAVLPDRAGKVGMFFVKIRDPDQAARVSAAIDSLFRNSLAETRTETQKAFQLGFVAMVDTILLAIRSVSFVVVLIIMAVMANTMAMTARERTSEFSTLKALGFPDRLVALLMLAESLSIASAGGALGIAATFPVARVFIAATGDMFTGMQLSLTTMCLQGLCAVAVGLVGAVIPAWNSARVSIVDGLRTVA